MLPSCRHQLRARWVKNAVVDGTGSSVPRRLRPISAPERNPAMDRSENRPKLVALEPGDQIIQAAITEIVRRLEWVREQTNTCGKAKRVRAKPRRQRKANSHAMQRLKLRKHNDVDHQHPDGADGAAGDGAVRAALRDA
jgi:hypothetical protein